MLINFALSPPAPNSNLNGAVPFTSTTGVLSFLMLWAVPHGTSSVPLQVLQYNASANTITDNTAYVFSGSIPSTIIPVYAAVADLNNDGSPDILLADFGLDQAPFSGSTDTLLLSSPSGHLVDASSELPTSKASSQDVSTGIIDSSGNKGIFFTNLADQPNTPPYYLIYTTGGSLINESLSYLPASLQTVHPAYTASKLTDVNGDGLADLIIGPEDQTAGPSLVYLNPGNGDFSHVSPTALPLSPLPATAGFSFSTPTGPLYFQFQPISLTSKNSEDLLVISTTGNETGYAIQILINNGDGTFTDQTSSRLFGAASQQVSTIAHPSIVSVFVADINGDGFSDFVTQGNGGGPSEVFLNDGHGHFNAVYSLPTGLTFLGLTTVGNVPAFIERGNGQLYLNTVINAGPSVSSVATIYGGSGPDFLDGSTASTGAAILVSGTGANVLNGGLGYDTLYGGGQSLLNAGGSNQQLLGGYTASASDTLNAGSGNYEFLATVAGRDLLQAGSGIGDFLEGGTGADTLMGSTSSTGSALLVGGTGADLLNGGIGVDTLVGGGASSLLAGTGAKQLLLGGYSVNAHDTLNAGSDNAVLGVAEGNNLLLAGTGTASLFAGSGNDLLQGGGGNAVLVGGSGNTTLQAGSGADFLVGGGQSLEIGGSGANGISVLTGGYYASAHDTLKAGTGSGETLAVVMGNNTLYADSTSLGVGDVLYAGTGNDTLYGAGYGNSAATAQTATNGFVIGQGNSTVLGGAGNDYVAVLNGTGTSSIDGGGGANTVQFVGHSAADATINTSASGVTTITFADSTQTATLSHVTGVIFAGDQTVRALS